MSCEKVEVCEEKILPPWTFTRSISREQSKFYLNSVYFLLSPSPPTDHMAGVGSAQQYKFIRLIRHLLTSHRNTPCIRRWQPMESSSRSRQFTYFKTTRERWVCGKEKGKESWWSRQINQNMTFLIHSTEHVTWICNRYVAVVQWTIARLFNAAQSTATATATDTVVK